MSVFKEFKEFIARGNALELAVGVIIAGAFGAGVNGLVADILMPPIGLLLGNVNFSDLYIPLNQIARDLPKGTTLAQAQEAGGVVMAYGHWLTTIISFIIIAFSIFLLVKAIKKAREEAEKRAAEEKVEEAPTTKVCPFCDTEISVKATRCPNCTSQLSE